MIDMIWYSQVGLLKENNSEDSSKESSPFKDILSTMERPPELTSPQSADYIGKKSFFQNFTRKTRWTGEYLENCKYKIIEKYWWNFRENLWNWIPLNVFLLSFKLVRSSSDQTPDPRAHMEARSPTQHLPSFYALSKMRKSIREKRSQLVPRRQPTIDDVTKELESVRDDLQV